MNTRLRRGFRCQCCGKWHARVLTDIGFQLPDVAWKLAPAEKERRLVANEDLCAIDKKRFFIRCVAQVPFTEAKGFFGWGLWVEVSKRDFFAYHDKEHENASFGGHVSNALPGYPTLYGKAVKVQPEPSDFRPTLWFPASARHCMALEQRRGISRQRHYEVLHENAPSAL